MGGSWTLRTLLTGDCPYSVVDLERRWGSDLQAVIINASRVRRAIHVPSMKILFCNYESPPLGGGGGVVMAALARELAKRHTVTVLTSRAMELTAESNDAGVRVMRSR